MTDDVGRKERILPGSENLQRWPHKWHMHEVYRSMGIPHYGKLKGVYKIPIEERTRAQALGYEVVRLGTYYAYVKEVSK